MRDALIRIERNLARVEHLSAGEWTDETVNGTPAVACPNCSRVDDAEESETQAFACDGCGWDGWIVLADFDEEVLHA